MQVVILSDIHFGKRNLDFLNTQLSFFEKQFFPYLLDNGIKNVIQLGDIFDSRKYSLNQMLSEVGTRFFHFFNENKINLYVIVGNHDTPLRETSKHSPLYQYKSKYIHIVGNHKTIEFDNNIKVALHSYFNSDSIKEKADIGLFHTEFNGLLMDNRTIVEGKVDLPSNNLFTKIYSGHFHSSPEEIYLNTPMALSFESFGCENGFFILDTEEFTKLKEDYKLGFIENVISPKFIKLYFRGRNDITLNNGIESNIYSIDEIKLLLNNNIIELHIEQIPENDKLVLDDLIEYIGRNLEYTYQDYLIGNVIANDEKMENLKDDLVDIKDILDEYIVVNEKEIPLGIDLIKLKNEFMEIYEEVLTEVK